MALPSRRHLEWRFGCAKARRSDRAGPTRGPRLATSSNRPIPEDLPPEAVGRHIHAVQWLTDAALAHSRLDALLAELLERICALLASDTATVLLRTEDGEHVVELASRGAVRPPDPTSPIPIGRGIVGRVAETRQPLAVEDLAEVEVLSPVLRDGGLRSVLAAPLLVDGDLIGVVHIGTHLPRSFSVDDIRLLQLVADRVALAIDRARRLESERAAQSQAETVRRQLAFLAAASVGLADSLDYGVTLRRIVELAVPDLADWCVVDAWDDAGEIHPVAVAHVDSTRVPLIHELRRRYPLDLDRPYGLAQVLRTGEPELYPTIDAEWRRMAARDAEHLGLMETLDARSSMCVPLRARGRTLGAVTFVRTGDRPGYQSDDLVLAQDLVGRCALALDTARLYRQAQDAVDTRDRVLSAVSHDLRNPLTSLAGFAQLVRRQIERTGQVDPEQVISRMREIEAQAARIGGMIDELLDATRLQAGARLDLRPRPTDLYQLVERAVEAQRSLATGHTFVLEPSADRPVGEWDPNRLLRVLDNLLSNAVKYSPDRGRVLISVWRQTEANRAWAVVSVRDWGIGIPAADIDRVFERFGRARNASERFSGAGLGLAGAREIIEQHGGTITVESEENVGSTFTLRLPLP